MNNKNNKQTGKSTKHISILGAPCSGKSTSAAGLFSQMKMNHISVEFCHEFAKDLTYREDFVTLSDQLSVFAAQHHKIFVLDGKVDFTISDGPFLLSAVFSEYSNCKHLPKAEFDKLVIQTYKMYDTINVFLESSVEYQDYGRNETQEEALAVSEKIKKVLIDNDIPYTVIKVGEDTVKDILKLI